jgi:hypothetical protein
MNEHLPRRQELLRAVTLAIDREVEHVIRVGRIAQVDPQPRRAQKVSDQLLQLDRRVVGVNDPRLEHHADHQVVQWPQQIGAGAQPVTERGAVQEVALSLINPLQPVQRQVVGVLADDQVSQQSRPRQALGNRHRRLGRRDHHLARFQRRARRRLCLEPLVLVRGRLTRAKRFGSHCRQGQRWLGIWQRGWRGLGLLARVRWTPQGF